jgi:DinB superfamily
VISSVQSNPSEIVVALVYHRPNANEHAPFYAGYIAAVPEGALLDQLAKDTANYNAMLGKLPESRAEYAYAPGKWSIKQVVGHVIDAERVFTYRALTFARGDVGPLPSFDENRWIGPSAYAKRTWSGILEELFAVRAASTCLLGNLPEEALTRVGTASGKEISVRALAYIVVGHGMHHGRILKERYLSTAA